MPLVALIVTAAVLSVGASSAAGMAVPHRNANGHSGHSVAEHAQQAGSKFPFTSFRTNFFLEAILGRAGSISASNESSSSSAASHSEAATNAAWERVCGSPPRARCALYCSVAVMAFFVLVSVLCVLALLRWWRRDTRHFFNRRRQDLESSNDGVRPAHDNYGGSEREGLLAADAEAPHSTGVHVNDTAASAGSTSDGARGRNKIARLLTQSVEQLNLHGSRLRTVLQMSPMGLFYGGRSRSSAARAGGAADAEDADAVSSEVESSRDSWGRHRPAPREGSATSRSFLRAVVSVATTTEDSSESSSSSNNSSARPGENSGDRTHSSQSSRRSRRCESACLEVVSAEGECAVGRSVVCLVPPNSPITPHVLPQLFGYTAASSLHGADRDEEEEGYGYHDDCSDSDSQRIGGVLAGGVAAHTSSSSMSDIHHSRTNTQVPGQSVLGLPPSPSMESAMVLDSLYEDRVDRSPKRAAMPHVETAIFDTTAHSCVTQKSSTVDLSVLNDLFEPDHFPRAMLHGSEGRTSSRTSHVSNLDTYLPPPATSGTATPASVRESNTYVPLPLASATAVLPVSNSLNDGLDMVGGDLVEDLDLPPHGRSYVPAAQQHHQPPQPVQRPPLSPPPPPPTPPAEIVKPRRKRAVSQYSEPWQPILVSQPSAHFMAAAAVLALPRPAAVPQPSPVHSCSPMSALDGALENELDDLMLGDNESALSHHTAESGRIFSGSSTTSTSRTVTPAMEPDAESLCAPTVFCPTALANGNNTRSSSNTGGGRGVDDGCGDGDYISVIPPASASIPVSMAAPPMMFLARTADAAYGLMNSSVGSPTWRSRSEGRRPLQLSLEERTLLMKSRKWLFPLIDGADEIETCASNACDDEAEGVAADTPDGVEG